MKKMHKFNLLIGLPITVGITIILCMSTYIVGIVVPILINGDFLNMLVGIMATVFVFAVNGYWAFLCYKQMGVWINEIKESKKVVISSSN